MFYYEWKWVVWIGKILGWWYKIDWFDDICYVYS
jgi:hypothetical protein